MDELRGRKRARDEAAPAPPTLVMDLEALGLSGYELSRPVLPLRDETHRTTLEVRTLNQELSCPVCMNILHTTYTVMECLHRFCEGCISKALRVGKKECPTCRAKCSSMRNLRPDPNFDAIIRTLYPNLEEYEQRQDEFVQQINTSMNYSALRESMESGIRKQMAIMKRAGPPPAPAPAAPAPARPAAVPPAPAPSSHTSSAAPLRGPAAPSAPPPPRAEGVRPAPAAVRMPPMKAPAAPLKPAAAPGPAAGRSGTPGPASSPTPAPTLPAPPPSGRPSPSSLPSLSPSGAHPSSAPPSAVPATVARSPVAGPGPAPPTSPPAPPATPPGPSTRPLTAPSSANPAPSERSPANSSPIAAPPPPPPAPRPPQKLMSAPAPAPATKHAPPAPAPASPAPASGSASAASPAALSLPSPAAPGRPLQAPHPDAAPVAPVAPAAAAGAPPPAPAARAAVAPKVGFYYSIKLSPFKPLPTAALPAHACLQLVPDEAEHRLLVCPFIRAPLRMPLAELAQLVGLRLGVPAASVAFRLPRPVEQPGEPPLPGRPWSAPSTLLSELWPRAELGLEQQLLYKVVAPRRL